MKNNFSNIIRDFVFGMEDGLVSNLGLVLGVYVGGGGHYAIILAGMASMIAGAFSMSAGSYLSSKSQREVYEYEISEAKEKLKKNPKKYLKEMGGLLKKEGFNFGEVKDLLRHFEKHNKSTFLINYLQKRVGISKERLEYPLKNALAMFFSFIAGSLFPIVPFILLSENIAAIVAIVLTIIVLFAVGVTKTIYTKRNWFKSGVEIVVVGMVAGVIGYLVGRFFSILI